MKKLTVLLLTLGLIAQANAESIFCQGMDPDYPSALISGTGSHFTVKVNYDLDVPGGASGSYTTAATGEISESSINLELVSSDGTVIGSAVGEMPDLTIVTDTQLNFHCPTN